MNELEHIAGALPGSALRHRAWWYGHRPHVESWKAAGYVLDHVELGRSVTLRRQGIPAAPIEPVPESASAPECDEHGVCSDHPDVVLVSCSARKAAAPAQAKELYTSALFRKQRTYAESTGVPWFILSAEHALVAPDEWLAPYDRYLPDMPETFRAAWGVWASERLEVLVGTLKGLTIEIHASAAYARAVAPFLSAKGADVRTPLAGLRQGEQLAYYGDGPRRAGRQAPEPRPTRGAPSVDTYVAALLEEAQALTPTEFLAQDSTRLRVPGLYSWWVDSEGAEDLSRAAGLTLEPGLVYAGLAGATRWPSGKRSTNTLWSRIAGMHLGGRHEFSTFRRSLGALQTNRPGGDPVDEVQLTKWMHAHLKVVTLPHEDADTLKAVEAAVLSALDPPLNLQGMAPTDLRRALRRRRGQLRPQRNVP